MGATPREYELIETDVKTRDTLDQTILPLEAQGLASIGMFLHHKYIVVMEKDAGR